MNQRIEAGSNNREKSGREMLRPDYEKISGAGRYFDRRKVRKQIMAEVAARQAAYDVAPSKDKEESLTQTKDKYFDFIFHTEGGFLSSGYTDAIEAKNEKTFARKLSVAMADLHRSRLKGTYARIGAKLSRIAEVSQYALIAVPATIVGWAYAVKNLASIFALLSIPVIYHGLKRFSKVGRSFHATEQKAAAKGVSLKEFNLKNQAIIQKYENYKSTARKIAGFIGIAGAFVLWYGGANEAFAEWTNINEFFKEMYGGSTLEQLVNGI